MTKLFQRKIFKIKSNSQKGKIYKVEYIKNFNSYWCECAYNSMSGKECAHIKEAKNQMWLESFN